MRTFQKTKPVNIKLLFLAFSLFLSTFYVLIDTFLFGNPVTLAAIENAEKKTLERQGVITRFLEESGLLLKSLNQSKEFKSLLTSGNEKTELESIFKVLAGGTKNLMQIRFIDANGKEVIRVDKSENGKALTLVPEFQLQDKIHRYYFEKSKQLPLNQVWFSALDLNIERGQIEFPFKPTLRSVMPIEKQGTFGGILVINYYMEPVINKLLDMPLYHSILVNTNGETLVHYNQNHNWSRFQDVPYTLKQEYPNLFAQIIQSETYGD